MKALFLIFHGLKLANGISKKIHYQVNAMRACGIDTSLCYLDEPNGRKLRMINSKILRDYETFWQRERNDILLIIKQHKLDNYVILHGAKHVEELDRLFDKADSLARHRNGIPYIQTLKYREYAGSGLSFIYSEIDNDFEYKSYIFKVPADETVIDINSLINFYGMQSLSPLGIRDSIRSFSWETQMNKIINLIKIS